MIQTDLLWQHVDARQAAEVEGQCLEELQREEAQDQQGKLEKARLRGNHALRKEPNTQDHARLLCEFEHLQQVDLLRCRLAVNSFPAQIYQPLYRQQELRDEQQRDLEIAFQDTYTEESCMCCYSNSDALLLDVKVCRLSMFKYLCPMCSQL
ncbi:centrosomal protein of 295 kDa-like isoform X2 [Myxocyprinus asiaticus]|uniref:centrosomal protein of 295 kDa-like isoform X2 n=1 Tax=Myxocyprinus asiaticus TaxID=70543 RepID=UPI0022212DEB|nr:centrosomal protein of 295 kDa-like isoform X2 [Myxocyprinus asiaticus]